MNKEFVKEKEEKLKKTLDYLRDNKKNTKVMDAAMVTAGVFTQKFTDLRDKK